MPTQSEQTLEDNLIKQLQGMEYERVSLVDEEAMLANLKLQLEKHNEITLSNKEFKQVLNHLNKGGVYDRAKTLRDKMHLVRDNGENAYIEFLNKDDWCQNEFQVSNQITIRGSYKNRYDVTILINGLPLVQIELKRRGLELKEAFNQVNRYRRHSYSSGYGLFLYIQLFVISNGVNTKYYSNTVGYDNDKKASYKFTSFWTDEENNKITKLEDFAKEFLPQCHISKMISQYMVLTEEKTILALRPYQYYAVEAIIDRVKNSNKNGYIWHTTGSGKTLTSFKASQILTRIPEIEKVVFVVDRNDLDTQTIREFNQFKKGSVDTTDNTKKLVQQFAGDDELIVTTIQKLNNAIVRERHLKEMNKLKDKKVVFIFDECHRSQFGDTHQRITDFFENAQLFGFTGTPIFADNASSNALGKRTTKDLFDDCLHKYVITDAIGDENVLKFSVEYYKGFKLKDGSKDLDIDVEDIDRREALEAPQRLESIVDFIIQNHDRKTHSRDFNAIFCVSSKDVLYKYYDIFKRKKEAGEHNLKIATIFSYTANEEDPDADGLLDNDHPVQASLGEVHKHSRDRLESYIADYNEMFGTSYTTKDSQSFYNYYKDVGKRVRRTEVDILLVVNMFLTGFDAKRLNTLYVDKNLRYHGLVQAYSRTNRILNEQKSQGNIVAFRNLKKLTDGAIELFSNKDAQEVIFTKPYEEYLQLFNEKVQNLFELTPQPESVDSLVGEEAELEFVQAFREVMRLKNVLVSFSDFSYDDTLMSEQSFNDFRSKYLDIYDKVRTEHEKEKVSILEDIDFELELIHRDNINVDYILGLLAQAVDAEGSKKEEIIGSVMNIVSADAELRNKRELIEKFIKQTLPKIEDAEAIHEEFDTFWDEERIKAFEDIVKEEGLMSEELENVINTYFYSGRKPRDDDLVRTLEKQPSIYERESVVKRLQKKISSFIETFVEGV